MSSIDPRQSLAAGIIWLVIALAVSFAIAASLWVGRVAREIVVQQHVRRLALETDQLASDVGQAVSARLEALRAARGGARDATWFERLRIDSPELDWFALADVSGVLLAGGEKNGPGTVVSDAQWFLQGRAAPWIGLVDDSREAIGTHGLGDVAAPVLDDRGRVAGVIAAHLTWRWATHDVRRLSTALDPRGTAQTMILDRSGIIAVGPQAWRHRAWTGTPLGDPPPIEPWAGDPNGDPTPRFERLAGGEVVLVARVPVNIEASPSPSDWQVQLSEPRDQVYHRANALASRILWISAALGAATALLGALGARHLTNRLKRLARSAGAVGRNEAARIEVPNGRDEVAQLAAVFAKVLDDLGQERSGLLTLSAELERRVSVRTREVERLAEEARYAAIVRERLKIARDLHDTLAHSMMAMLSEVRLLRRLQTHDPGSLAQELQRAEEVAREGLNEARNAIAQMRVNAVRDTGLGPALGAAFDRFRDRTGLICEFCSDPSAAGVGDERAEAVFRMAEEVLRNIERHAMATRVDMALSTVTDSHLQLRIVDDGIGFDTATIHPGHYGLVGLREQAHLIDAVLRIESVPDQGTAVSVQLRIVPEVL